MAQPRNAQLQSIWHFTSGSACSREVKILCRSEDLAPEDTSPESLSKLLPAAKAWLASSQEKLQEAKAKVKTHQALL